MKIHAEIQYVNNGQNVHSDICPQGCVTDSFDTLIDGDTTYRHFLHSCLDEWLNKSNGTGGFYIASEEYLATFRDG
jgi:hypothetical protein